MKVYTISPKLKKFDSNYSWDHDEEEDTNTEDECTDGNVGQDALWDAWHDWDKYSPQVHHITASKVLHGR